MGGAAITTVTGTGVAFYSRASVRGADADQLSFMRLNECLVICLGQCLQVHIRHVNGHFCQCERRQLINERKGKVVAGEAGGNPRCPVVSFDGAGYQYISISVEGERSALVGVTPVVAITSNDKLSESVNQHFVQCFEVFDARLWQVAVFPLHLLELIPALVVGGLVQRFPLIPSLEATNIAILGDFAQFFFGLRLGFLFLGIAMIKAPPIHQYHMGSNAMLPKRWRVMFVLNQALSDQLQEAFPLVENNHSFCAPELHTGIVKSRPTKAFYIGEVDQSDPARFTFVFFKAVSSFLHVQPLKASPCLATLSCVLFGIYYKIQHGTYCNNDTTGSGQNRVLSDDSCKSSTTAKKTGEREHVGHPAKKSLLQLHVPNHVTGAINSLLERHWVVPFRNTGKAYIFHVIKSLLGAYADFVFRKVWIIRKTRFWSGNPDRWNTWDLARWIPFSCWASFLKFHRVSPLQNVKEGVIISSLGLVLKNRLMFVAGGAL